MRFELLALLRVKAGTEAVELEVTAGARSGAPPDAVAGAVPGQARGPTVLEALQTLESSLAAKGVPRGMRLLEGDRTTGGVLAFVKKPEGRMRRVLHPAEEHLAEGETIVLSTAMGGG